MLTYADELKLKNGFGIKQLGHASNGYLLSSKF